MVGAVFDRPNGKAKRDKDAGEGASNCPKKKKNKQWREGSLMSTTEGKGGQKPIEGTPDHFEKLLEGPCPNHAFPIKHLYKDCILMKRFLSRGSNKGGIGRSPSQPQTTSRGRMADFRC